MKSEFKKFNLFVMLSTLGVNLIEIFIPIYLYKNGYNLNEIYLYFIVFLIFSFISSTITFKISDNYNYKVLVIFSLFSFLITNVLLINVNISIGYLVLIAFFQSLYKRSYMSSKRYYAIEIFPNDGNTKGISLIFITIELASVLSMYIGGLIFANNTKLAFVLSVLLFFISSAPLYNINKRKSTFLKKEKISFKKIGFKNLILMVLNETTYISIFLYSLYTYIYISEKFSYIGSYNLLIGISSIITIYLFSKKMDENKRDYKYIASTGIFITLILKLLITRKFIYLFLGLVEGVFLKLDDMIYTRNIYYLGKSYLSDSYNKFLELMQTVSRILLFIILLIFRNDIKVMIAICSLLVFITIFLKFDDGKGGYE